ncbi:MAG: hypothetical protein IJD92_03285 [Bacilli bacterium]|nr:hypothetical protein [Bacilli bacterium]
MNFYKEFFKLTFEIIFAINIIFLGYIVWDNFDLTSYETAKYYDNINEIEIVVDGNITEFNHTNNIILHNIGKKDNNTNLLLKINKKENLNSVFININNITYNINEIKYNEDEYFNYYLIDNSILNGYETKEYNIELLNVENNIFDYEFITNI